MNTGAGLRQDPRTELLVGVRKTPEGPKRQEGGFDVLDPGLDPAFFLGIPRRTGNQEEAISLCKFGIRSLDFGVVIGSPNDRAFGIIENDALRNPVEPLESSTVEGEPGANLLLGDNLGVLVMGEAVSNGGICQKSSEKFCHITVETKCPLTSNMGSDFL